MCSAITWLQKKFKTQNSYFDHFRTNVIETTYSQAYSDTVINDQLELHTRFTLCIQTPLVFYARI